MKFKFLGSILFTFLTFIIYPHNVFAGEIVQLSSPLDGSTISSSKLEWQTPLFPLYSGNNFRVQVDDDSSFSSLNKDYYTNNTYYSPTLIDGVWYFRVKAKDSGGVWSDWSSVWGFTLLSSTPIPENSPSPSPSPDPTVLPTPSPTSSPSPAPSPNSQFLISDIPSQIDSNETFSVTINLSLPSSPNTEFYIKGAFKKADGSNYFGYTKVSNGWVKNGSSYSSQYKITTDSDGNWSGILEVKPDSEDSGFEGTSDYIFKVGRYSASGSGPVWSNDLTAKLVSVESKDQNTAGSVPTAKKLTNTPIPSPTKDSKIITSQNSIVKNNSNNLNSNNNSEASVAAAVIEPPFEAPLKDKEEIKEQKQFNFIPIVGGVLVISGISSLAYIYFKKRFHEPIFN